MNVIIFGEALEQETIDYILGLMLNMGFRIPDADPSPASYFKFVKIVR